MKGQENDGQAIVTIARNTEYKNEVNRQVLANDTVVVAAPIPAETENYTLSDLEFRIVRY